MFWPTKSLSRRSKFCVSSIRHRSGPVRNGPNSDRWPPLSINDDELRASIEQQRRQIEAGTAKLYSHEDVMAEMRAKLAKARDG